MHFIYSQIAKCGTYSHDGLAHNIPLRIHKDTASSEVAGTLRAQRDWDALVSRLGDYHGGLGERFSFVRVTIPECLPERLEIVSYANEFAFLYDGTLTLLLE